MTREPDNWWEVALCAEVDPEIFYPPKSGTTQPARKICASCPVIDQCPIEALTRDDQGVRAGLTAHERRQIRGGAA